MHFEKPCVRVLLLACLATTTLAPAAQAAADIREEIIVRDKAGGSLTALSVEEARRLLRRIAGAVDLVPTEAFEGQYALNLQDMLANVPGVYARQRFAEEVRLSIRGSGLSRSFHMRGVKLFQDGVPLTLADNSADFQEVDPLSLRYVEVYKGANALRFGGATLGGAIQYVTPTGRTARHPAFFSLEGGSHETARIHASLAHSGQSHDYFIAATGLTSSGFRQQSDQASGRVSGNVGFGIGEGAETRFYLAYNHIDQEVPGTISLGAALAAPETVPPVNILNDHARDIRSLRLSNKTSFTLGAGVLDLGLYAVHKSLFHPIFQVLDETTFEYGAYGRIEMPWTLAGRPGSLVLGVNAGAGKTDAERYVNVGGRRGDQTLEADLAAKNLEFYGEARLEVLAGLSAIIGTQFVYTGRDYDHHLAADRSAKRSYDSLSPKLGLLWEPSDDLQIFANLSRSYEPPTFSELVQSTVAGFVPLDAQRAWTGEIGTRGTAGGVSWDLALYRAHVRDELLQFSLGPDIPASTFNAAKTLHQGVELGVTMQILENLSLRQTYMLNDFRFRDDAQYGDNRLAGIPQHVYRAELEIKPVPGLTISPGVDWAISRAHVDFANSLRVPRYAVADLRAGYAFDNGPTIYGEVRNIFDKRYISTFGTLTDARLGGNQNVFYPGDGRAVYVGLKWGMGQ